MHIRLPEGYAQDNADSPGGLNFGDPGSYQLQMRVTKGADSECELSREFTFGNKGILFIEAKNYSAVNGVFDAIQVRDANTISLKGN